MFLNLDLPWKVFKLIFWHGVESCLIGNHNMSQQNISSISLSLLPTLSSLPLWSSSIPSSGLCPYDSPFLTLLLRSLPLWSSSPPVSVHMTPLSYLISRSLSLWSSPSSGLCPYDSPFPTLLLRSLPIMSSFTSGLCPLGPLPPPVFAP